MGAHRQTKERGGAEVNSAYRRRAGDLLRAGVSASPEPSWLCACLGCLKRTAKRR
ncbi:hypothetical protein U91I_02541 [alpha proteobacterium U9-1i]|nr:hypothetical protein U91I_02541 [alpha proteobacterium U9-1i]